MNGVLCVDAKPLNTNEDQLKWHKLRLSFCFLATWNRKTKFHRKLISFFYFLVARSWLSDDVSEWKQQPGRLCFSDCAPHAWSWPQCTCLREVRRGDQGRCSLTPSAVFSFVLWQTHGSLPSSSQNRWICFLQQGAFLFLCAEQSKIPLFVTSALCRILHTRGQRYFSGRQIAIAAALFSAGCTANNLCLCVHTLF